VFVYGITVVLFGVYVYNYLLYGWCVAQVSSVKCVRTCLAS
jgi:hypothetical protein